MKGGFHMKICIIGATGHYGYVLEGLEMERQRQEELNISKKDEYTSNCQYAGIADIVGIAPGSQGEDITPLVKRLMQSNPSICVYDDYCKMLDEIKPDIAVVCCYFADQAKAAIEAIKRGIHVFMDKPVATTFEDLELLKKFYYNSNVHLAAMFGIRYTPWFLNAKEYVDNGAIGKIRLMNAQKSYKLGRRGEHYKNRNIYGGTIPWVGTHAIDWLHWFSNEKFISVYAAHSNLYNSDHGDLEVSAICSFVMTGEIFATVSIDYLRPATAQRHDDDRIRIVGTEGVIEVRDRKIYLTNKFTSGTEEIEVAEDYKENIFCDFLAQIRGEKKCMVSAEDSFYVTEAALLARTSADEKREVRFL